MWLRPERAQQSRPAARLSAMIDSSTASEAGDPVPEDGLAVKLTDVADDAEQGLLRDIERIPSIPGDPVCDRVDTLTVPLKQLFKCALETLAVRQPTSGDQVVIGITQEFHEL